MNNTSQFLNRFSQDLAFMPRALSGFAGVAIGILIANWVGII